MLLYQHKARENSMKVMMVLISEYSLGKDDEE